MTDTSGAAGAAAGSGDATADAGVAAMFGLNGQDPAGQGGDGTGGTDGGDGDGTDGDGEPKENDFATLPDWAQTAIRDLRRENAAQRAKVKAATKRAPAAGTGTGTGSATGDGTQDVATQVAAARAEAKAEAKLEMASVAAQSAVEAALTGIVPDPAAVAEDLNMARYVTDEGEVDREEIALLKAKYQTLTGRKGRQVGHGRSGGQRTGTGTAQEQFAESMQGLLG